MLQSQLATLSAGALKQFEEQFQYPLGEGRCFRIDHGEDYSRFYRAIGEGCCFVVENRGKVVGTVGVAIRQLVTPGGDECRVAYLGDLKISPAARNGRTLIRLAAAVQQWTAARTDAAFGVVMDGTSTTPVRYTGRVGIPRFTRLGELAILRVPTGSFVGNAVDGQPANDAQGDECYRRLSGGRYACVGGDPKLRSLMQPQWLIASNETACGRLEDTRRAKILIDQAGTEMRSAHLSCFVYRDLCSGVRLLRAALQLAASSRLPAVFAAVPPSDSVQILEKLKAPGTVVARATVFGRGLESGRYWNINTAEI